MDNWFLTSSDGQIVLVAYFLACVGTFAYGKKCGIGSLMSLACCAFIPIGVLLLAIVPLWLTICGLLLIGVLSNARIKS